MAGSLNKVLLIGRLGNDPEIKQMQNGKSVARLSVATSENWKDKNSGEKKEKTEWHRVVIFNEGMEPKYFELKTAITTKQILISPQAIQTIVITN